MHGGRPMGESFDHRPAGWIRQSRKFFIQLIHNHMVVNYPSMSSVNFGVPDFSFLTRRRGVDRRKDLKQRSRCWATKGRNLVVKPGITGSVSLRERCEG